MGKVAVAEIELEWELRLVIPAVGQTPRGRQGLFNLMMILSI